MAPSWPEHLLFYLMRWRWFSQTTVQKCYPWRAAAIDFVRDAFGHLKAIAFDKGGAALLQAANIGQDAGVVDVNKKDAFIAAAKTR